MTVAELFARIGLKTDEAKAKSFQRTMTGVKTTMIAATAAATGTALAIRKITSDAFAAATALKQFETETGASAQELQKWQAVAEQTNQSAQAVDSAVRAIAANQEKIKLGQGDISGYQLLGINPNDKTPFEILEEVRSATVGMTDAMKKNILQQMGIGSGLLQTLNLTREEFDAMAGNAWIISPQAIETLNKTKSSVDLAGRAIKYMKTEIAVGLSPQIRETTKRFQEFIKANEKGIIEGFKKGYRFVELFLKAITNTATMINDLVVNTIGWEKTIKAAAVAFGIFNAVMMASPLGLITAGIILLVAVMDDLYTYSKGGKSLFGKMVEQFPVLEQVFNTTFGILKDVLGLFKAFATGDEMAIDNILSQWGQLGEYLKGVKETIEGILDLFKGETWKEMNDFMVTAKDNPVSEASYEATRAGVSAVTPGAGLIMDLWQKLSGGFGGGGNNQNNNITQNIYGTNDPEATGRAANRELQKSLNSASAQLSRNE